MVSMTNCSSKVELSGLDFLRHGEGGGGGGGDKCPCRPLQKHTLEYYQCE